MNAVRRVQRAWLLWRLDRLGRWIEPERFDRALSARIDGVLARLDALSEEAAP